MNLFLRKIVLFALGLGFVNVFFFFIIYNNYYKNYKNVELEFNTFLLADSHGKPLENYLEKYGVYNFSAGGDSYFDMKRKLKYLIRKTEVDAIIITVDDHTLSQYRERLNNLGGSGYFTNISDFDNFYEFIKNNLFERYIVLINPKVTGIVKIHLKSKFKSILLGPSKNENHNEFSKLTHNEQMKRSKERAQVQFPSLHYSEELVSELNDIIEICKMHDIILVGIKFPLSRLYINEIEGKSYNADNIFMDESLTIFDFKKIFIKNDNLFSDEDHLNEIGAKKFVNILIDRIKHDHTTTHIINSSEKLKNGGL